MTNSKQYAASAAELSSVYLYRGSLPPAETYADHAIHEADKSESWWVRMRSRVRKAMVEHIKNKIDDAYTLFQEAEDIQKDGDEKKRPVLYGEEGWVYNMFLLDTGRKTAADIEARCKQIKSIKQTDHDAEVEWVVLDGLNHVALALALLEHRKAEQGWQELEQGLGILRDARSNVHLAAALLANARACMKYGRPLKETEDSITETIELTEEHGLLYYCADAYILDARNAISAVSQQGLDQRKVEEYLKRASCRLERTKEIVGVSFYHLRKSDVTELEQSIRQVR